jgi:hypothetical protein
MFPLNVFLAKLKVYGTAIIVAIIILATLVATIWILTLRHKLSTSRAETASLQQTVNGYAAASQALKAKLDTASKAVMIEDQQNQKLLGDLQKSVPKDPAQATSWAIAASQKIAQEAKR